MSKNSNGYQVKESVVDSTSGVAMPSCLRNGGSTSSSSSLKGRVTFPKDDRDLVTAYLEPDNPWDYSPVTPEDLITLYIESCEKHGTKPWEQVIEQLKLCYQPHPALEISGIIDLATIESLEAVLRRVRFQQLRIQSNELRDDAAVALFDMLEYYESAVILSLSCENGLDLRSWQACSHMMKRAHGLVELDVRGTPVNEQVMPVLCRPLKVGSKLSSLQLSRCGISGRALVILVIALRLNSHLQELTLADNDLIAADAAQLSALLRDSTTLRYLDVSNNAIGDDGCATICDGLVEQRIEGLQALVLWNTRLTVASAERLAAVLASQCPLETLNIGQNQIGSSGLAVMQKAMLGNKTLRQLGVQAAHINCDGAEVIAQVIQGNKTLQRIDARSNHIGARGLAALQTALQNGAVVHRIDLDDIAGACQAVVEDIRGLCQLNEARAETCRISNFSRKISLTCETLMMKSQADGRGFLAEPRRSGRLRSPAPSPIPSPSSSPVPSPSRNRFRVCRVSEESSTPSPVSPLSPVVSRFRVTVVEPEPQPVVSDGSHVQVGFQPHVADNHSPVIPAKKPPPPSPSPPPPSKPQTSMEKLLGLFQNPGSLFASVASVTHPSDKEKASAGSSESAWDWDWKSSDSAKNNNI